MNIALKIRLIFPVMIVFLSSCGTTSSTTTRPSPTLKPMIETPSPSIDSIKTQVPEHAERIIQIASSNLANELTIGENEIRLMSVEAVEWADTSLGCPQPGMTYAQVITHGYKIMLMVDNQTYTIHTDRTLQVVLCDIGPSIGKIGGETDPTMNDGGPNQPKEWGEVDTSMVTPPAPGH